VSAGQGEVRVQAIFEVLTNGLSCQLLQFEHADDHQAQRCCCEASGGGPLIDRSRYCDEKAAAPRTGSQCLWPSIGGYVSCRAMLAYIAHRLTPSGSIVRTKTARGPHGCSSCLIALIASRASCLALPQLESNRPACSQILTRKLIRLLFLRKLPRENSYESIHYYSD
jgi:hypothetical protein